MKKNHFKQPVINTQGRLIDGTKDVTDVDITKMQYHKLQSQQFDQLPEINTGVYLVSVFASFGILVLFFVFAYILLNYIV